MPHHHESESECPSDHYIGLVDMGSNGIRYSITDMSPDVARGLPTIYLSRAAISLYDAQFSPDSTERQAIPEAVIVKVVAAYKRFKEACQSFGVKESNIRVYATEATRVAPNSKEFCARIKEVLGPEAQIILLAKEDEGRMGANGVASSSHNAKGLIMDLGGGSTQISWVVCEHGKVSMPDNGSVSMPYGAAALMRRVVSSRAEGGDAPQRFIDEVTATLRAAFTTLMPLPPALEHLIETGRGIPLYVSGGGFRGWGYVLMSMHPVKPYPISVINGFTVPASSFFNPDAVQATVLAQTAAKEGTGAGIFRVSDRRASQIPAVCFLVSCLRNILPDAIKSVYFCQGGVREGVLFAGLSPEGRMKHPLQEACIVAVRKSTSAAPNNPFEELDLPLEGYKAHRDGEHSAEQTKFADAFDPIVKAFALTMFAHSAMPKDTRAGSAARYTTTGALAGAHGLSHFERAALSYALFERWGGFGGVSPSDEAFVKSLCEAISDATADADRAIWWCQVLGRMGAMLGEVWPAAGVGSTNEPEMKVGWKWVEEDKLQLQVKFHIKHAGDLDDVDEASRQGFVSEEVWKALKKVEKTGKTDAWGPGGGYRIKLTVHVNGMKTALPAKTLALDDDD